jgi:anaerobic ribonucleoside-triphosphate reductase activating protein
MYYGKIKNFNIANGPGVRTTLFVSGCLHHCKGCFQPETWSFSYGEEWTKEIEDKFIEYCKDDNITGVSILGGEPLDQNFIIMLDLLRRIKVEAKKPIWMWTGYKFEELATYQKQMLEDFVEVLVDGRFEEDKKDLSLKYCGSKNQRVIDIKKTFEKKEIVLYEEA